MKESAETTKLMVKVKKVIYLNDLLILTLFNTLIGEFFHNDGTRYEGEWKEDMEYGKGMKRDVFIKDFLINIWIGKLFYNDGNIYEGERKDGKRNGQGMKGDLLILTLLYILIGKYFYNDGSRYKGEWKNDKKHG